TLSVPRRLTNRTSSRRPVSGWNGWVTTTKPESSLDDAALCRLRRNPQPTPLARPRLGDHPFPDRQRTETARLQLLPQFGEKFLHADPFLDEGDGFPIDSGRACALVPRYPFPRPPQDAGIGDEVV